MMKAYVFVNRYLSGVQVGIQAAHALARLCYENDTHEYHSWIRDHETIVILDQGKMDLFDIHLLLQNHGELHSEFFRETGLNDAVTAVAYIPSEKEMNEIEEYKNWLNADNAPDMKFSPVVELLAKAKTHKG